MKLYIDLKKLSLGAEGVSQFCELLCFVYLGGNLPHSKIPP